jgi:transposase
MVHRNAPLSETGRLRLARCVVDEGWPLRRAAERFQVSVTTAARWAARYRALADAGMADRSSRPHRSPGQTPTRTERRIIKVRVLRRWGPARIGYLLGLHPSTVHRVLTRYGMAKLRWLDRPTGRVIRRMEPARCGDMVHLDVKKLGKIPAGGGWRMLGRTAGNHNSYADKSRGGNEVVDYAGASCQISEDSGLEHMSRTVEGVAMTDSVPRQDTAASNPRIAHRARPRHLRLIQSPTSVPCSDEQAHELPAQDINHDGDRDGPPPIPTLLCW